MAGRALITAPAVEPITLGEVRLRTRVGSYSLEQAPTAPSVALGSTPGNVDNGAHRYLATFVTAAGETNAGEISDVATIADKTVVGRVNLSGIPTGSSLVTARKIYRTIAGGATYLLLATIADNTTTTYADNIADASLGAGAPSTNTTVDPELTALLKTAREEVELQTRRALITQTWELSLDCFPTGRTIRLPYPPLQSVTSVKYVDANGITQTMDPTQYVVDTTAPLGQIVLVYGAFWPVTNFPTPGTVLVRFVCGYGVTGANVPERLKAAIKYLVSDVYELRQVQPAVTVSTARNQTFERMVAGLVAPEWSESDIDREVAV